MKHLFASLLLILTLTSTAQTVKVMSYNIRLDVASDGENRWDNRKNILTAQVLRFSPDFLGIQEALPQQMDYLDANLNSYKHIGVARDNGEREGEFSAIFYNASLYRVLQQSTLWLSETPDKPSFGWDAACRRICTYGLFENIKTNKKIWIFNTHFDHVGDVARINSAKMILAKIKEVNTKNLPFVLTGDFNLEDTSESIKLIAATLSDSKTIAKKISGPNETFNGFITDKPATKRIDYIFIPKTGVQVTDYKVIQELHSNRYPSDHFPVYTELKIK